MLDTRLVFGRKLVHMVVIHWAFLESTNLRKWSSSVSYLPMIMILRRCKKTCLRILRISIKS
ncbi:serine--tRNA ligase [Iris pallida]|uniref:Serine--tRNA ligase n=1 Tax=Iris pallida TaxID=29817 RepID=A0AAX6HV22_IRIPA|nr:serine--tRNA ligase [Iris pallida]